MFVGVFDFVSCHVGHVVVRQLLRVSRRLWVENGLVLIFFCDEMLMKDV